MEFKLQLIDYLIVNQLFSMAVPCHFESKLSAFL